MARKYSVIEADGRPGAQMKKSAAQLLIRRLLAVEIAPFVIRKLRIEDQPSVLSKSHGINDKRGARDAREYQHHLEPKINPLTIGNSAWLRHLYGYDELNPVQSGAGI